MKKTIILVLALVLPIGVFLFLKFFGKNEFEVSPLFQDEEISFPTDCNQNYTSPYILSDSLFVAYKIPEHTALVIFVLFDKEIRKETRKQLKRVDKEIGKNKIHVVKIRKKEGFDELRRCVFLMEEEQNVVLVNGERQILGQYEGDSLEDMDRLIAELQIILKQY
jgi:hypothetical protein